MTKDPNSPEALKAAGAVSTRLADYAAGLEFQATMIRRCAEKNMPLETVVLAVAIGNIDLGEIFNRVAEAMDEYCKVAHDHDAETGATIGLACAQS